MVASKYAKKYINKYNTTQKKEKKKKTRSYANVWLSADINISIANISNGTLFGDLDWPLNATRWFVSISRASCFLPGCICRKRLQILDPWNNECIDSAEPFPEMGYLVNFGRWKSNGILPYTQGGPKKVNGSSEWLSRSDRPGKFHPTFHNFRSYLVQKQTDTDSNDLIILSFFQRH